MRRPSPWLILVVILLGVFLLREPRLQRMEEVFLGWFLQNSQGVLPPAPVTLVEIGRRDFQSLASPEEVKPVPKGESARRSLSPLEYALFLQATLDFQPTVIGIEPILIWHERDQIQEQVFLDQAMRVPKLLVGIELGGRAQDDLATEEFSSLPNVTGNPNQLPEFAGIKRQPDEDIRLISTPGFKTSANEWSNNLRVPMLFRYRGEIVPSFPLQAIMLWLRITPADVQVALGSKITLPNGWKIPIHDDGTLTINPLARQSVRRLTLTELLLAAQEHGKKLPPAIDLENLKEQIVLLRLADDRLQPPNLFSTAIATIQNSAYIRSAPAALGWIIILAAGLLSGFLWVISKQILFLTAILFSAGYSLVALVLLGSHRIWLPTFLPLALLGFLVLIRLLSPGRVQEGEV